VSALQLPSKYAFALRVLRHFIPTLTLLAVVSAAAADKTVARPTTLHVTLHKAIEMALAKNFSIEVEQYEPQIARGRVTEELGHFDPVLGASFNHNENRVENVFNGLEHFAQPFTGRTDEFSLGLSGVTSIGTKYNLEFRTDHNDPTGLDRTERFDTGAGLSLTQPLLKGGGTAANLAQLRIARNHLAVSEWKLRQQVIDTINSTIAAYNELHFAHENLGVATGFRELALQLVRDNSKRVDIGVMSPLNVTTARAEAAAREEAVIVAERQIKDKENDLKGLITHDLEALLDIRVEIEIPPTPAFSVDVRGGVAEALVLRPDYRQTVLEIERRNIVLALTKNDALPRLDLTASLHLLGLDNDFGTSTSRIARPDTHAWSAGAIFSVPIPNRAGRGSVLADKLSAAQALVSLQQLEQQIVVEVDNANGAVVTARERIRSTGEARVLARESLDAGEERLRAGTGTTFEVLELQKKLAESEAAELRARTDFNKAVSEYERKIGTTLREHRVQIDKPR
jgi:outer membrane protein TolC